MKKSKEKLTGTPSKKTSAARPTEKRKKDRKSDDKVEELYGVHIISDRDIENHFGVSEKKSVDEKQEEGALDSASKIDK